MIFCPVLPLKRFMMIPTKNMKPKKSRKRKARTNKNGFKVNKAYCEKYNISIRTMANKMRRYISNKNILKNYDFKKSVEENSKILKEKNMSQNAFAKQVGLAGSTISDWKNKKTNPSADKIMDICMVLEVTPEQLLTGKGIDEDYVEDKPQKTKNDLKLTKVDIRIIETIHSMKEEQRKRLMKYMEALRQLEELENL